jgi:hypothetical protein
MKHTLLVTPSELEDFADRMDTAGIIPELINLLVRTSVSDLTVCRIPYRDSIGLPGLDGLVETESGYGAYVPKRTSLWEIGRGAGAQTKATKEYRKRTNGTPDAERAVSTFVFVTPRSKDWSVTKQRKWLAKRKSDGWGAIRILDGVQVCDWLREFPGVGKWLLNKMGLIKNTVGLQTPAEHWSHLTQLLGVNDPPLPPKLFLAGRDDACRELGRLFRREIRELVLSVESERDAEDFVAAYIQSLDEETQLTYGTRCLLIDDPDAWESFCNLPLPHVLVAGPRLDLADANEQLHLAAREHGHDVLLAVSGAWSRGVENIVRIISPSQSQLEKVLVESSFPQDRAGALAAAGAHSLAALKRYLRGLGSLPPYATWENARVLAQASLIGKWKGDRFADREAMEILLGKSYGEWIEAARSESLRADTPLIQRNEVWKVISRGEAWSALGPRLTNEDLDRFAKVVARVLGEVDPQLSLPKEERYVAFVHDKVPLHSEALRQGLTESLALMAVKAHALSSVSAGRAEVIAYRIVHDLLESASWELWASLNSELPLLAEAAPGAFLEAVDDALSNPSSSVFTDIFKQESSGFAGRNYISGLLWALETLAWSPKYLGRATLLLGDLASIDPGGNWGNRPRNSLADIYLPWHMQTLADLPQCKAALEALLREQPDVGWNLLLSLLPTSHGSTSGTRKPTWRDFIPAEWSVNPTNTQYWARVQLYSEMCIRIASANLSRLIDLTGRLESLPDPVHTQLLEHLVSESVTSLSDEERLPLWSVLAKLLAKHRKYSTAQWAMSAERLGQLEEVAQRLQPRSEALAGRRLFSDRDFELYEDNDDFHAQQRKLDEKRQIVVRDILATRGPEGVIDYASGVESAAKLGDALGAILDEPTDRFLLPKMLNIDSKLLDSLVRGFLWRRYWAGKLPWVDEQLGRGWSSREMLELFIRLPFLPEIWTRAEAKLGAEVSAYWKRVPVNPFGIEPDLLLGVAQKLVEHGQPAAAVDCLYVLAHEKRIIPADLTYAALQGGLSVEGQQKRIDQHHIDELIKSLQESEPVESEWLFKIEWMCLPLLDRSYGGEPKALEYRLASSPAFYLEVIGAVFRSDKDAAREQGDITDQERRVAQSAYSLLHGWRRTPGTSSDGNFDGAQFASWLEEVKTLSKNSGHFRAAMNQIGHMLAFAPPDPDGLWVHAAIAAALDAKDAAEMRDAFATGLFNRRGVHGFSQGAEEKGYSEVYRKNADALANRSFHRVAGVVRGLAESYERDAERESGRDIFDDR